LAFLRIFNKKEETDEVLLTKFKLKGNQDDLAILYDRYIALIYGICLKYLKNREDAQDACIEIYEKLKDNVNRFEIINFKSWIAKLSVNHCLMFLRANKSKMEKRHDFENELLSNMENEQQMHPINESQENRIEVMLKILENLKEDQRNCIMLFYFHKHSYIEIAQLQDMSENEVKSHIQNGKRNLKIMMTSQKSNI
jgi:RNA polymerase sigma-70 factor (ECF subfamily)